MLQSEMRHDVMPGAFDASFPADDSVEAAKVPTPPTHHVLPKALPVRVQGRFWVENWAVIGPSGRHV
jgi:hypothetical protein